MSCSRFLSKTSSENGAAIHLARYGFVTERGLSTKPGIVGFLVIILHVVVLSGCVAVNKRAASDEQIARANVDLATEYFRKGQLNFALDSLKKALSFSSKSVEGNALMALVYDRLEQPEKAETFFDKAQDLVTEESATYSYVHNLYGTFLCQYGRIDEAESHFDKAISNKLNRNPEVALENAGFCAFEHQQFDKAEKYLRQALKISPSLPGVLFKMAKLQFETQQYLSARAHIQRYHAVQKEADSLALAIDIERAMGAEQEANKLIGELKKLYPNSEQAMAY